MHCVQMYALNPPHNALPTWSTHLARAEYQLVLPAMIGKPGEVAAVRGNSNSLPCTVYSGASSTEALVPDIHTRIMH